MLFALHRVTKRGETVDKNLEYYLAQARRLEKRREKGATAEIRRLYKSLLKDLQGFVAEGYEKYAQDDRLTFGLLQEKSEGARFLEETTGIVNSWFPSMSKKTQKTVQDMYSIAYDGMISAIKKSDNAKDLTENLKGLKAVTPEVIKKAAQNPIHGLTLSQTLEKNRKEVVYELKKAISVGLANGDRYSTMARRITERVDIDYRKAVTIVRTEGHRVQESGFHDAAKEVNGALQEGVTAMRLHKTWCTMEDERVRDTTRADHRRMNGVSIPVEEEFDLGNGVKTEEPGSSGSAANDINCRCFLKYELKEDKEIAKSLGIPKKSIKDYKKEYDEVSNSTNLTEDEIRQKRAEIVQRAGEEASVQIKKRQEEINAEYSEKREKIIANMDETFDIAVEASTEADRLNRVLIDRTVESEDFWNTKEYEELNKQIEAATDKEKDLWFDYDKLNQSLNNLTREKAAKQADAIKNYIAEVRKVNGTVMSHDVVGDSTEADDRMCKVVRAAMKNYPADWVERTVNNQIVVKHDERGSFNHRTWLMKISGDGGDRSQRTAYHELGHVFEDTVPHIVELEKAFYDRRTAGEKLVKLKELFPNYNYRDSEVTKVDNFISPYMGKDYGEKYYELVSMGFERAMTNPSELFQDEDYAAFILGVLTMC